MKPSSRSINPGLTIISVRKKANEEIARIKKERRNRLEAYKRARDRWQKVIKELEDSDEVGIEN